MKERLRYMRSLLVATYEEWSKHDAQTQGAALSYFTVLSLAPLLVIAVSIAGLFFGKQLVQGQILGQMQALVPAGADAVRTMLLHAQSPKAGILATIVGFVVLAFSASGVFYQLRKALNRIWDIPANNSGGWFSMISDQFFSFAMVVGIGFLLLVSLALTTFLAALGKFAGHYLPVSLFHVLNILFSLAVITVVFALIFRFVPQQTLPWRRLWPGSFGTAVLFTIGKFLLGLYLGRASVTSSYGAAGSLVVLLIWVYYSSQLFLFGAEFTRIYACHTAGVCLNVAPPEQAAGTEEEVRRRVA
jgi:membrane protein